MLRLTEAEKFRKISRFRLFFGFFAALEPVNRPLRI
jgi:hypothetical protein